MPFQGHRPQRFPFVAGVHLTALDTGVQIAAHTEDLSPFGCFVQTATPFVNGTKVRVRISHDGMIFAAEGTVVYARERVGMGIGFTSIEPSGAAILEDWLTEVTK
jgi:PilZ domain